ALTQAGVTEQTAVSHVKSRVGAGAKKIFASAAPVGCLRKPQRLSLPHLLRYLCVKKICTSKTGRASFSFLQISQNLRQLQAL
ncbi:MAG: hypothetical protein LBC07_05635, partial [Elusimicrobiota bacterium]|nr:hypothetical protein [Elusimicrobiota bacterium]